MTDALELHQRAARRFGELVHQIADDQWDRPTPCTEWDLRALVNHLVYEERWVPPLMRGMTVAEVGDRYEGDLLGDDPKGAWDAATREATAALEEAGALERTVHLSSADVPGEQYAFEVGCDLFIHGWDVARSIGADGHLDPELAAFCYERWAPREEELRASGAVGPKVEIAGDAGPAAKLLGLFGRRA